jgi:hypothetical protein
MVLFLLKRGRFYLTKAGMPFLGKTIVNLLHLLKGKIKDISEGCRFWALEVSEVQVTHESISVRT